MAERIFEHMNRQIKGIFLALLGGICWGVSGSLGQYLFMYQGINARWLVPVRLGLAGVVLLAYSAKTHGPASALAPWKDRDDRRELFLYGLAVSLNQFFYYQTIEFSSASLCTILQSQSPVFILLITSCRRKKKPTVTEIFSVVLALAGVFLITTHGNLRGMNVAPAAVVTGLLAALFVAVYNTEPVHILQKHSVLMLQGWAFVMGGILFTFVFHIWTYQIHWNALIILSIAAVVLIGNVIAFPAYMKGISYIGPQKGILFGFAEPASAALIGAVVFHQTFTGYDVLGFILFMFMLLMTYMSTVREKAVVA